MSFNICKKYWDDDLYKNDHKNCNPKITTIAKRPETGNAGQLIKIYTNHFTINFCTPPNKIILYQFDVDVEILMSDGSWYSCGKDERLQVMKKIINKENFPLVWYDEGKNLYSIENLIFRFLILNLVKIYTLKKIIDFIQKRISIEPHDLVKILDILFKQTKRSDIITIKNQSYRKHQRLDDLGGGIGLGSCSYQSIILCERGLTLNINKSFVTFYQNYNLVQFLSCYMNHDIQKNGISSKDQALLVRKLLKFLWFVVRCEAEACQYRLKSFGRPANQHKYIINGNEQITAVDYFNDIWKFPLRYPHLPVVELYHPNDNNRLYALPMELVAVDKGQPNLQALTTEEHIEATRKALVHPNKCYRMIQRVVDERRFNHDSYLQKFGIIVDVNEMLLIPGRILPLPEIKYKLSDIDQHDIIEGVQIGRWWLNKFFKKVREIRTWAIVLVSQHKPDDQQICLTRDFTQRILQVMSKYGVRFNSSPIEKYDAAILQTIVARMNELKMLECEVIIYILDQVGDEMYNAIKQFAKIKIGMITKCIPFNELVNNYSHKMNNSIENLVKKLNILLDDCDQLIPLISLLNSPTSRSDVFMFFGIGYTHIAFSFQRASVAYICGSTYSTNSKYSIRLLKQVAPKEKISYSIIRDLHIYVGELIREFFQHNLRLPNKLVFYQVDLGNESFQTILDHELKTIEGACQELYGHNQVPRICFVLVKQCHNTRFFTWDEKSNRAKNIPPGTVIDTDIVSPNGFHFYLNSDAPIQGTAKPMLYQVLCNEIGFTSNEIQILTHYLCHTDAGCTNTIAEPLPIYYAKDNVAYYTNQNNSEAQKIIQEDKKPIRQGTFWNTHDDDFDKEQNRLNKQSDLNRQSVS
ncbi:unnamed protein product [Rotaria sp. Silwood1]|nr:unnamed protein product [Rotaria sp. Silwood1]